MRIAITGGSGALGRALISRLLDAGAERIATFSRCQHRRDALIWDFGRFPAISNRIYWHDLSDRNRLARTFSRCEIVVHCAAAKVVGAHPDEPEGLWQTNVVGTANVIAAALEAGVGRVLVISSDKAVQPTNAYGVSKAAAEFQSVAANAFTWPAGTRVSCLRYGNVVGSTSSVAVKWREAIQRGDPLELSDERMTRFWVSINGAVSFVLDAVSMMRGGEIFIPNIPAAPITRLAEALGGGPPYTVIGIRPGGEKLHESMLGEDEVRRTVRWHDYYVVTPSMRTWDATPWPGEPISDDLVYRSDVWRQLTVEQMRELV